MAHAQATAAVEERSKKLVPFQTYYFLWGRRCLCALHPSHRCFTLRFEVHSLRLLTRIISTILGACAMATQESQNHAHPSSEVELTGMKYSQAEHEELNSSSTEALSNKADSFDQLNDARQHLEIIKQQFEYVKLRFRINRTNTTAPPPPAKQGDNNPLPILEPMRDMSFKSQQDTCSKSVRADARRRSRAVKTNLRFLQNRRQMFAARLNALQSALSRSKLRVVGQTDGSSRTKQHAQCQTPMPLQLRKTKRWCDVLGTPPLPQRRPKSQFSTPLPPPPPPPPRRPCPQSNKCCSIEADFGSTWTTPPPPSGPPPLHTIVDAVQSTLTQRKKTAQQLKMNELRKKLSHAWEEATRFSESARESAAQAQGAMRAAVIGVLRPISAFAATSCKPLSHRRGDRCERASKVADVQEVSENCHMQINERADQAARLLETILDTSESGKIILEHRARNWHGGDVVAARAAMSRQMHTTVQKFYR